MNRLVQRTSRGRRQQRLERGAALLMVTTLLLSLTLVAMTTLGQSRQGIYRAVALERRVQATSHASAGLSLAYIQLPKLMPLDTISLPYRVLPSTVVGDGTVSVELRNNRGDIGDNLDTDGLYVLRSTGISRGQTQRRVLEAMVYVRPGAPALPAALLMGKNASGTTDGNIRIIGQDRDIATTTVGGIGFETAGQTVSFGGSADVTGVPGTAWAASYYQGESGLSAQLASLLRNLAENPAAVHYTGGDPLNLGTTAAPQITVIDGAVRTSSHISGAGVLLIRDRLEVTGQFDFEGLILIEQEDGRLEVAGNTEIDGALAVTGGEDDIDTDGPEDCEHPRGYVDPDDDRGHSKGDCDNKGGHDSDDHDGDEYDGGDHDGESDDGDDHDDDDYVDDGSDSGCDGGGDSTDDIADDSSGCDWNFHFKGASKLQYSSTGLSFLYGLSYEVEVRALTHRN